MSLRGTSVEILDFSLVVLLATSHSTSGHSSIRNVSLTDLLAKHL
jgi:hypothetical protein